MPSTLNSKSTPILLNKPLYIWLKAIGILEGDQINITIFRNDGKQVHKTSKTINQSVRDYFTYFEYELTTTEWLKNNTHYATIELIRKKQPLKPVTFEILAQPNNTI